VTIEELESALQSGATLIDVREPDEYTAGHVPGAVLVPLASVPAMLDRFSSDSTNYVICKSGARSYRACEFLVEQGLDAVNVEGGTMAWIISGRGTVAGDQPA
jgi:rhodanese-related sulfurtransferase